MPLTVVSLAAARHVSRRWLGLVEVPPALEATLDENSGALGGEGGRQLSNSSRRLIDSLRRNARTSAKGGHNAAPAMDPGSGMRTRPKRVCKCVCSAVKGNRWQHDALAHSFE